MKSTLGECVIGSIGAIGGAFGIAGLMSIGGAIGNVVSGAISIGTTVNSIKSVASLANQGSGVARGGSFAMSNELMDDVNSHGHVGMSFSGARNESGVDGGPTDPICSIYSPIRWYTFTIDANNSRQFWLHEFTPFETGANPPVEASNELVGHYLVDTVDEIPVGITPLSSSPMLIQPLFALYPRIEPIDFTIAEQFVSYFKPVLREIDGVEYDEMGYAVSQNLLITGSPDLLGGTGAINASSQAIRGFTQHAAAESAITRGFKIGDILKITREGSTELIRNGKQIRYTLQGNSVIVQQSGRNAGKIVTVYSNFPGTRKGLNRGFFILLK